MREQRWHLVWERNRDLATHEWTEAIYNTPLPSEPRSPAGGRMEKSYDGKWMTVYALEQIRQDDGVFTPMMIPIRAYLRL